MNWNDLLESYRVKAGEVFDLHAFLTGVPESLSVSREDLRERKVLLDEKLQDLQDRLYASQKHRVLIVLQGMDTSGKDGTIKRVFRSMNPQGVRVQSFRRPSHQEASHDFLWRIHRECPANGEVVVFNRSHYEDVVTVRVQNMISDKVCEQRFDHINNFERLLTDNGTLIIKFFLSISKDEQKMRLQSRLDNPHKNWKFDQQDLEARKLWDDYLNAYSRAIEKTSTETAPWFVVPADQKWFRNWLVSEAVVSALESLELKCPEPDPSLQKIQVD